MTGDAPVVVLVSPADVVTARQILADAQAEQLDNGETIHHER